jgi:hypothetical protein
VVGSAEAVTWPAAWLACWLPFTALFAQTHFNPAPLLSRVFLLQGAPPYLRGPPLAQNPWQHSNGGDEHSEESRALRRIIKKKCKPCPPVPICEPSEPCPEPAAREETPENGEHPCAPCPGADKVKELERRLEYEEKKIEIMDKYDEEEENEVENCKPCPPVPECKPSEPCPKPAPCAPCPGTDKVEKLRKILEEDKKKIEQMKRNVQIEQDDIADLMRKTDNKKEEEEEKKIENVDLSPGKKEDDASPEKTEDEEDDDVQNEQEEDQSPEKKEDDPSTEKKEDDEDDPSTEKKEDEIFSPHLQSGHNHSQSQCHCDCELKEPQGCPCCKKFVGLTLEMPMPCADFSLEAQNKFKCAIAEVRLCILLLSKIGKRVKSRRSR